MHKTPKGSKRILHDTLSHSTAMVQHSTDSQYPVLQPPAICSRSTILHSTLNCCNTTFWSEVEQFNWATYISGANSPEKWTEIYNHLSQNISRSLRGIESRSRKRTASAVGSALPPDGQRESGPHGQWVMTESKTTEGSAWFKQTPVTHYINCPGCMGLHCSSAGEDLQENWSSWQDHFEGCNNMVNYTALQNVPKSSVDLNGPPQRSQV